MSADGSLAASPFSKSAQEEQGLTEIFVEGFRLRARIGVNASEQERSQALLIDFSLKARLASPVQHLSDTLCYERLTQAIEAEVMARHHPLLERLAEQLAELLLKDARVVEVRLRLTKPEALREAQAAGVAVHRRRAALTSPVKNHG
jgi:dihydroneopterin aldolase